MPVSLSLRTEWQAQWMVCLWSLMHILLGIFWGPSRGIWSLCPGGQILARQGKTAGASSKVKSAIGAETPPGSEEGWCYLFTNSCSSSSSRMSSLEAKDAIKLMQWTNASQILWTEASRSTFLLSWSSTLLGLQTPLERMISGKGSC